MKLGKIYAFEAKHGLQLISLCFIYWSVKSKELIRCGQDEPLHLLHVSQLERKGSWGELNMELNETWHNVWI